MHSTNSDVSQPNGILNGLTKVSCHTLKWHSQDKQNIYCFSYLTTDATMLSWPSLPFGFNGKIFCLIGNFDVFQWNSFSQNMFA